MDLLDAVVAVVVSILLLGTDCQGTREVLLGKGFVPFSDEQDSKGQSGLPFRSRREVCETRPSLMTEEAQGRILRHHNKLRGKLEPIGADEFSLVWDNSLAERAQAWADKCIFEHDFLSDCEGNGIGQNLYTVFSDVDIPDYRPEEVVQQWFDEEPFYKYHSATCETGKVCGHYTQVVWSKTRRVGCGVAKCPTLLNPGFKNISNAHYVVCTYNPPGNYRGAKPYISGLPCSECDVKEGGVKCQDNLCVPCLPKLDPECECPSSGCGNGGVLNKENCECVCQEGYYGTDCSKKCEDSSAYCSHWKNYCGAGSYKRFMKTNCAKTCGVC